MYRTVIAEEPYWKIICSIDGLKEMILIRLFPRAQWNTEPGRFPWVGHPLVDKELTRRRKIDPLGIRRGLPPPQNGNWYPTYPNWRELEPAKHVIQAVWARNNRRAWRIRVQENRDPDDSEYSDEEDYLAAVHKVFQPDSEHGYDEHKKILKARNRRRDRTHWQLELFARLNFYPLPEGPLGDLTGITKYGAPVLGVPKEDMRTAELRRNLAANRTYK